MRAASSRHCTDERSLARPLLVALLAAVMLLQQANCQPACPGADGERERERVSVCGCAFVRVCVFASARVRA